MVKIQDLLAKGCTSIPTKEWPELEQLAAYLAWALGYDMPVMKVEAHQGTGQPTDFIGIYCYLAKFDSDGSAR